MIGLALANLGALYMTIGKVADAESYLSSALRIYRRAFGNDHPMVATVFNNLGTTLREEGEYAEAEDAYRESLCIREALLGPDDPITATSMNNLAELLWTKVSTTCRASRARSWSFRRRLS
jgi:tetratricopeptide (TPR) repeat protein